ncbi:hypothetical protein [Glacieibacterium sp.]|uniref:hypothetical protein n=1 Tax=Glacieibacterium sp. TaxID=2860237 RepID=UPI003AFF9DC8
MAEYETTRTDAAGRPVVDRTVVRDEPVYVERRRGGMGWLVALLIIVALVVAAFAFGLIDIGQTSKGSLPDVKVETSGGSLPKFDVNTADVNVGTKKTTVEVPTVDVTPAKDAPNKTN